MNYIYQTLAKSEYKFGLMNYTKMAAKMATFCQFALVYTLIKLFIYRFLPNYIYGLLSSKSSPKLIVSIVR